MPEVLQSGIFKSIELKFPEKIPKGIKAECKGCLASLKTKAGDKGRAGKKISKKQKIYFVGWFIKCPECGANVFFPFADASDDLISRANGWNKEELKEKK